MKAVIYARFSAGPDQTKQSIEGQLRVCKKYIADHNLEYVGYYADEHITGRTDKRPKFQQMISDAEDHQFDVVVVYSTDRFSRNKFDSVNYKNKLKKLGIKILYAAENIPEGPEGILLESIMEGWAEYYSEELSRKVKRGMHDTAMKCKATGGVPVLGYTKGQDKSYIIVENEAAAVRQAFKMLLEGHTIVDITKYINKFGFTTGLNRPFSTHSTRRLLSNKRYIGIYKYADVIIPNGMPRIIDDDVFYAAQEILNKNKKSMPKKKQKYLLSGKLYCGNCGELMSGCSGTSKTGEIYSYYRCRKNKDIDNISKEYLEMLVASETSQFFRSDDQIDKIVEMLYYYMHEKNASEGESRVPKKRLSDLKRQKENLVNLIAETGNKALVDKLEEVEQEIFELERAEVFEENKRNKLFSKEELKTSLEMFLDGFDWDDQEKTNERIIDALIKKVILYDNKIEIYFNIGPGEDPGKTVDIKVFDSGATCSTI